MNDTQYIPYGRSPSDCQFSGITARIVYGLYSISQSRRTWTLLTGVLIGGLTLIQAVSAQCLQGERRLQQLDSIAALPNEVQTGALLAFKRSSERCGQTADSLYARTLHRLGVMAFVRADYEQAAMYSREAVRVNGLPGPGVNRAFRVKSCYNLARALQAGGVRLEAREAFRQTIRLGSQTSQHQDLVADAYGNLSHLFQQAADYQQAAEQAELGIMLAERLGLPDKLLFNLNAKATAQRDLGQYALAEQTLTQALALLRETKAADIDVANTYADFAVLRERQGRYAGARQYYEKALAQHQRIGNAYGQAEVLANMGYLESRYLNNNQAALALYQRALPLMQQPEGKARILDNMGGAYWRQHRYADALRQYQTALRLLAIFRPGQSNPAAESVRQSAYKEYLLTLMQDKADAWLSYAKATGRQTYLRQALDAYRVADQMVDYMRWEQPGQQSKLFWRTKTRDLYERAIETCWRLGNTEAAFRFLEKSRAVMLADKLNELGARQKLTSQQNIAEQQVQKAVNEQQSLLADASPGKRYDSLRVALLGAQEKQNAFRKQVEVSNPAYFRYKYDTTTTILANLKAYLKPRQAQFVSYFAGDSALYVLAVAAGRDTLIRQPLGAYKQTVRQFMSLLANPDAMNQTANIRQFLRLGNSLYGQLLAPLGLRGGRIIVSPDGAFVPLEALSRSATKPDYLVMTHAFSYAYSAGLLLKTQPSQPAGWRQTDFLGVAPVSYAPALGQVSLPGSDGAVQDIASRFGSAVLLTRAQATRRAFLTEAAHARVVHLFTHGTATDSTDTEPRLYFADSTLNLSDLGTDGLPITQLVVLAACKTGVGSYQQGEGVFSMARGFAALGVPSVLTTLWSVDNQATYDITDLFEQYLTRGLPKDEALQQAQRDWLTTADGAGQLPTYWAGLIVVGNTEPLSRPVPWSWLATGLGGLVVVGAWLWRRKRRTTPAISSLRPA